MSEYSVEEVRLAARVCGGKVGDMLNAYAERIEADEVVVPTRSGAHEPDCNLNMASVERQFMGCDCKLPDHLRTVRPPAQAAQVEEGSTACDHRWVTSGFGPTACVKCGRISPQAQVEPDWRIAMFDRWRAAAQEKGYAGIAEAVDAAPTAEPVAQGEAVTGTFDCPICGSVEVHYHSAFEVCAWAAAQANRFLISLGHPEIVMRTKDEDERRTADFRNRVADVEEMLRDAGHSYQWAYARLAAQPRAVPDGWVLVPREPTPKMLAAVAGMEISVRVAEDDTVEYPVPEDDCAEIYRAMLAANPQSGESA